MIAFTPIVQDSSEHRSPLPPTTGSPVSLWGVSTAPRAAEEPAFELAFSDSAWNALESKDKALESKKPDDQKTADQKAGDQQAENPSGKELTEEEQRQVEELKKIDKNTRTHEQAHLSAAGGYARVGAQYNFVTGPDGKRYANGGHVDLDVGKEKTPEETIRKADTVRRAALAPADPSSSDRQIAAAATKMKMEAHQELSESDNF
jgi:hypothetical protein